MGRRNATNYTSRVEREPSRTHSLSTRSPKTSRRSNVLARDQRRWLYFSNSPPLGQHSRPAIRILVPKVDNPHSTNSMKPAMADWWPASFARSQCQTKWRAIRASTFSSESSTIHPNLHLSRPWSKSVENVSFAQLGTTRNKKEDVDYRRNRLTSGERIPDILWKQS
jgi:hypothetical protein